VGEEQRWVGAGMGSLLRRTNALSADVYLAMIARGYRGEAHPLDSGSWRALDSGFLVATAVLAAGLLWMG
jgi:cobalt/nickel transport system permease protein